jgi:replicative DNA helicase
MSIDNLDLNTLKVLVTNKKHALDFSSENDAKLFLPDTWNFANIILGYIKTYKEIPTLKVVVDRLAKGNNDKLIENIKNTWAQIDAHEYDDKEFKYDVEKLKKRFAEKEILKTKESLGKLSAGSIDVSKAISEMQKTIQGIKDLNQTKTFERRTLKEAVPIFREEYNAKMENPDFDAGIKTGYSFLDFVTDGLRPGELVLVGAESGGGKSMFLMNIAVQMWLQGNTVDPNISSYLPGNNILYFSLEMPFKPTLNRVLSRLSGCPSKLIRNAKLNETDVNKVKDTLRFINKYPNQFEIVDIPRGATMETLELIYEDAKLYYDPKIIVIDYLSLLEYEGGASMEDWLKLEKISEKMHEFARVHGLIVLSAVQLNRNKGPKKEEEDRVGLHRIGRSAGIIKNANIGIQIETRPKEKYHPDMLYHLIKNRDGELGKGRLIKNLSCGTLIDDKIEEDKTTFELIDPDDISHKIEEIDS